MKFWIIWIVLFNIKLSIAYVYCDGRAKLRHQAYEELQPRQEYDNYIEYNDDNDDYGSNFNWFGNLRSDIPDDLSESTTCTAYALEANDSLSIAGPNLKSIKFTNSSIAAIPSYFFKNHPSLQDIYLNHSHVNDIDMNAFESLENLQTLYLEHNSIIKIKIGIFNSLKNLKILDISCNQIRIIEETSFRGFVGLNNLNISYNNIQNISTGIFESNLRSLCILDLSHNNISTVELQAISNLFHVDLVHDKLITNKSLLDLSFNKLKIFNFSQLPIQMDELNLDNNNLETINGLRSSNIIKVLKLSNNHLSKFSYLPKSVRYLNLSNNIIQCLNISSVNAKLHTLDVSQNLIKIILPNTFENMTALSKLYVKNNKLIALPIGLFKNLKNLKILNLSGNHLKKFEFGTFSGLANLLGLDISENLFNSLDYKTFHALTNLTVLNIANNGLITLNPYNVLNYCKNLQTVMIDDNPWNCESLLNFTTVLQNNHVQVVEGSNSYVQNHLGHACYMSDRTTENSSQKITIDSHQLEKEIKDLRKLFEFKFRNSTFYDFFQNYYKNFAVQSQESFNVFDDYFNKGFENSSFYRNLNKNISIALPKEYDEGLQNLTDTLNLLNLKLSKISQTNLINSGLLNASQVNLNNYDEVLSNFSHRFDSKFKSSNFYKFFNKNFTNLNALNESTVDVLNSNLKKFSKSVDNISNYFENHSSIYKLLQETLENGSTGQVFLNEVPETLTSNISKEKFTGIFDKNQDTAAQQIASLRGSFITFMIILITILLIALLLPILKKFRHFFTRKSEFIDAPESTTNSLSLRVVDDIRREDV